MKSRVTSKDNRFKAAASGAILLLLLTNAPADETDLVGRWQLSGDVRDSSRGGHHGRNHNVTFTDKGLNGHTRGAAEFDGRTSYIEIPSSKSLQLGTGTFSISLWVHTAEVLDDVLGDLIGKYDPATRTGFNFSIQNHAGVTSSQSNHRHVHFGIDNGRSAEKWTDHGRLGKAVLIYGMAVYNDQLFVGTCEAGREQAGRVFRYDGKKWTDCSSPDKCNAVSSLAVYRGKLYVGVSKYRLAGSSLTESRNLHLGGKVYRYDGDGRWTHCGTLPDVEAINGMVVYRDRLYAGSMYAPAGFFRYEGGTEWTSCGTPDGKRVEALTVHNGHIYATGYDEGAVYRYDGRRWEHLGKIEGANQTYGFATYGGELFVSEWPHAKVFRFGGGKKWLPAGRLGEEKETMPLMVYNGKMYAGTLPSAEVYRFDGPQWTKIARLDFTPNVRYRRTWTMAVYRGRLFAGTLPTGHVHSVEIGRNVTYDRALPAGWVHLAAVRNTDHLQLYVNGNLVATSAKFHSKDYDLSNDKPFKIGFGAHDYLNGKLKDVRLYRRALTQGEVTKLAAVTVEKKHGSVRHAPLRIAPGILDSENTKTLGLSTVQGTHSLLYRATDEGYKFCHHPNLIVFRGRLYCMWSNGLVDEDASGQRILYSHSADGRTWTEPALLAQDKQGKGICVAAGFHAAGGTLVAYHTVTGGENFHPDTALTAQTSQDGLTWSQPRRITSGFFIAGPQQLPSGRLVLAGEHVGKARGTNRMRLLYTDDRRGLTDWRAAQIEPPELKVFGYTEPSFYRRRDETVVVTLRNYSGFLYASISSDNGRTWSVPAKTNFPDSTARASAGNLPDGTAYLINNPMPKQFDRRLLTIAISRDGTTFKRMRLIRGEPTKRRYDGKHKLDGWQYPHAAVWKDDLYVAYSINKEDIGLTRIAISDLTQSSETGKRR